MPPSDTDGDSLSDELSPTDGYFTAGNMSRHMVQDPSMDIKPEPKTLIAPPQSSRTGETSRSPLHPSLPHSPSSPRYAAPPSTPQLQINASSSRVLYNPPSPTTPSPTDSMFSESNPLANGPPPAYSPSPAPPELLQDPAGRRYNSIPEEEQGFLRPREPQSMGGPVEGLDERTPLSGSGLSPFPRVSKKARSALKKSLLVLLVFVGAFTILMRFVVNRSTHRDTLPIGGGSDELPIHDRPVDAEGPFCPAARYRDDTITYEFPLGTDLSVIQTTHQNEAYSFAKVSTVGEIRLRKIPQDSQHGNSPYFTVEAHVSDPELEVLTTWDEGSKTLKISTPRYASLAGLGRHCVSLEITAWFPENSELTNLNVEAVTLTLRVLEDVKVNVSGRSRFFTATGDVWFPTVDDASFFIVYPDITTLSVDDTPTSPLSSRRTIVDTVSGSISGAYPLEDLLQISSQSGSVNVQVVPYPADPFAPMPADLEIQTSSGSIKALLPAQSILFPNYAPPPRNYITRVHSNSGSVSGSYYLGSDSHFKTNSGSIKIIALPVLQADAEKANVFETHTLSGSTAVDIQDPIFISPLASSDMGDQDPYRITASSASNPKAQQLFEIAERSSSLAEQHKLLSLKSSHSSTAASVQVHYPDAWAGTIHAKAVSGSVSLKGAGIRFLKNRKGPGFTEILAKRGVVDGDEGSTVEMNSVAGSLKFEVY